MTDLTLHIEYLLRHHDCVILPGVGAFLRSRRPARYAETTGKLEAPKGEICFNSSITTSDGLLAHSVARMEGVSFEQAVTLVSSQAETLRSSLRNNGELTVGRLGLLKADDQGLISFHPAKRAYNRIFTPIRKETGTLHAPAALTQADTDRYLTLRIPRHALRVAAMIAALMLVALSTLLPSAQRNAAPGCHRQYASVIPLPAATQSEEEPKPVEAPAPAVEEAQYYLIVATFKTEGECREYIASQNDSARLGIVTSGKCSRVYSASASEADTLRQLMRNSEHKSLHPQSWIWERP